MREGFKRSFKKKTRKKRCGRRFATAATHLLSCKILGIEERIGYLAELLLAHLNQKWCHKG